MTRLLLLAALIAAAPARATVTEIHYVMGTYLRITVDDADSDTLRTVLRRCFTTTQALDKLLSRFHPDSELSRLNAGAATGGAVTVSGEMAALLRAALALRARTDGAFDVSAGALTHLWRSAAEWPDAGALAQARQTSGPAALAVQGHTLARRAGTVIDIDGIAKGWAVDRCVDQLRDGGVRRAFLSFGESSIYALGAPMGERGWSVTVRGLDDSGAVGVLTLRDEGLSASAVFGHERMVGARRVGHIVDPRSGLPLTVPGIVAVVGPSATVAEAFSKALLIDGSRPDVAVGEGAIRGALLIGSHGIRRLGTLQFESFDEGQPIETAAEVLR